METIEEIKIKLNVEDLAVLNLCDHFMDQHLEKERLRGESAERRANIILSMVGAASIFLVFLAGNVLDSDEEISHFVTIIYAASVLWILRAIWYSLRSLHTQNRYRVTAESIFSIQEMSEQEAMKDIISGKLWEYRRSLQPNTERLFYLQRGQRAFIVFAGLLLLLGVVAITIDNINIGNESCLIFLVSLVLILIIFWLFGDRVIEKIGIWNHF